MKKGLLQEAEQLQLIQEYLPDVHQKINMLFLMIKQGILSGGNQIWLKVSDNKPIITGDLESLQKYCIKQLSGKRLFVVDCFCGANENSRLSVRFIVEVAWQAHFVKNMFIRPEPEELENFKPDFVVLNASKATNPDWQKQGLNSENFIFFNLTEGMADYRRNMVWRRDEKRNLLCYELLPASQRNSLDALLCECGEKRRYCNILRTLRNRKNNSFNRS